ncbi:unnamed protein product [Penicillium salamii]|uniref:RNase III domain-containing protein n=1 Tax=Penicillium salamii TaxID=1612424 RepID=A0A9W4ISY1_9EURO|nr:unnamed protein product [Penicillium salamii]CAG8200786.1 unnamed protein product [Penicillium salamii]CAG8205749.1 unnamed protein product [Penicillium salamii]CAG8330074.1 unnamed protein product [Penicillium salamii]CAG8332293.1 unnamed protein product [Penicillium salamii]
MEQAPVRDPHGLTRRADMKRPASVAGMTNDFHKRPKHAGSTSESDPCLPTSANTKNTSSSSRLLLLQQLVREISNEEDFSGADSEVVRAISGLDNAFCRTTEPLSVKASIGTHSNKNSTTSSGTPSPPSILDNKLERAVFTHPAMSNNNNMTYDRLEVLGDAYIELIATKIIWDKFPKIPAGRMSQIREILVKNETLAGFAETFGFDRKVSVPPNYNTPSKRWTKTKGDVFEAYVAAVVLSDPVTGYQSAETWLTGLWMPVINSLGHQTGELRSKEALAKKIMGKNVKLDYIEARPSVQHKGGTQTFFIAVYLTGWGWNKQLLGSGQGLSKAAAGDEAAKEALHNESLILEIMSAKESGRSPI